MDDEISMYVNQDTGSYVESLIRSRSHLSNAPSLLHKLDQVISAELDLALLAAEKAKSEILKQSNNTVRPIK